MLTKTRVSTAAVITLVLATLAFAGVPQTINYQGYLKDTVSGAPASGPVDMTFSLYDVATGGSPLWSETHAAVPISNGLYSVRLGSVDPTGNPLNRPFDREYFLGISVNGGPEMIPRQALTSVPYAMKSITVETVPCLPGDSLSCYTGPENTKNVGRCTSGTRVCSPSGTFGACIGEILPVDEICINTIDDNCNGQADDGCPFPVGTLCSLNTECASGFCTDGYCCNSACNGLCETCAGGTCSPIPAGQDPINECPGTGICGSYCNGTRGCVYPSATTDCGVCQRCSGNGLCVSVGADTDPDNDCTTCRTCDGSGSCKNVANGQDPQNDCPDMSPCSQDGFCKGDGTCRYYGTSTIYTPESCNAGTNIYSAPDTCSGSGTVNDGGTTSCGPYTCSTTVCRTSCTQQSDCATGYFCDVSGAYGQIGACLTKLANGSACSNDARDFECSGGFCSNGFCCSSSTGSCCATGADCSSLAKPASCDTASSCSGYRVEATCSAANVCQTSTVSDQSGCSGEICTAGSCTGTGGLFWSPLSYCDPSGVCTVSAASANCNDANLCTDDFCSPSTGCSHTSNTYSRACYTGSPSTENVGLCHGGTQTCSGGSFGACLGEVVPATETCSGNTDENCNGQVNEQNAVGCTWFRLDNDQDTIGVVSPIPRCYCAPGIAYWGATADKYTASNAGLTDCDDNNALVNPGRSETCSTGYDDNCDGTINENGATGCIWYSQDLDRDGYGSLFGPAAECRCTASNPWDSTSRTDCNDSNPNIKPTATELCDGIDNNCSSGIDEGSIASLCPTMANSASSVCNGASGCSPVCQTYWHNIDGVYSNGCEVQEDSYDRAGQGDTCGGAVWIGNVYEYNISPYYYYVSGNSVPTGDSDWYYVYASDNSVNGPGVRFDVRFSSNPGSNYRYDLYQGSCSGSLASNQTAPTMSLNQGYYYIRVYRASGASPAGENYEILITNNFY